MTTRRPNQPRERAKRATKPAVRTRARGRPKGSGIDDSPVLTAVLELLAVNRDLKPTTAIKRVGVTDPSAVRRLREKLRAEGAQKPRLAAAALKASRPKTVSAELLPSLPPSVGVPEVHVAVSAPTQMHPPLAADTEKRTREALLLAAYLDAMAKSLPQAPARPVAARTADAVRVDLAGHNRPGSNLPGSNQGDANQFGSNLAEPPKPEARPPEPRPSEPPQPETRQKRAPEPPRQNAFNFPGMPPFLQPFQQPQVPPPSAGAASQAQQMEGMKLAVEAMTSMTKLQLHITENAFAFSPLAMMLQGQAMVGQMLLASFSGQLDAMKPKKPDTSK